MPDVLLVRSRNPSKPYIEHANNATSYLVRTRHLGESTRVQHQEAKEAKRYRLGGRLGGTKSNLSQFPSCNRPHSAELLPIMRLASMFSFIASFITDVAGIPTVEALRNGTRVY